jgi:hypothetical protein
MGRGTTASELDLHVAMMMMHGAPSQADVQALELERPVTIMAREPPVTPPLEAARWHFRLSWAWFIWSTIDEVACPSME